MVKNGWADQSYITQPKRPRSVEELKPLAVSPMYRIDHVD